MAWRNLISRSAVSGSLEQFPNLGIGAVPESFSNIDTPVSVPAAAPKTSSRRKSHVRPALRATPRRLAGLARVIYRPRFLAHVGLISLAGLIVLGNDPARAHSLSVKLLAARASTSPVLDDAGQAAVAADIAEKSQLLVTNAATKTATQMTEQVAMLTSGDAALAKRQVVATAGNATRDISKYTVQNGDTLSDVANKFGITTSTIKWANGLDDADAIAPGQALTILPVTGLLYTVKAGDTPATLASAYQANAAQIVSYNDAEAAGLSAGQQIIIPDGIKAEAPKPAIAAATTRGQVAGASTIAPRITNYSGGGNSYALGYCTYYVASRRAVPSNWGNANTWYYNAQASGFSVGSVPVAGAIAWTGAGYFGHVAYVESVSGNTITISEMNFNGNWNHRTYRTASASSFRYIY